ncbi:hypothetical protein [Pseudomonas extremaustralis]|uniref:hypothetical protein n=1 Tax=Pseudomonas extremaustralis TaxID=359110 RepID=UPI002307B574|nr:hypothetical protein [Pseudomonas extremaustralis]MDB1111198.1 hypothetical protein [Pseudomonas extremaustralis]
MSTPPAGTTQKRLFPRNDYLAPLPIPTGEEPCIGSLRDRVETAGAAFEFVAAAADSDVMIDESEALRALGKWLRVDHGWPA